MQIDPDSPRYPYLQVADYLRAEIRAGRMGPRVPSALQLSGDTGASVASFDAPERTNELMFDKMGRRIYLAGDDYVAVFAQKDADHYEELAHVASDKGAKTAILVPEINRLYVAVAGKAPTKAALLQYDIVPQSGK